MTTALQILNRLQKVDVLTAAQKAILETEAWGEDAQRKQMFKGLNRDEQRITNNVTQSSEYAELTVQIKSGKGQPTDRITLKDTGDYYSGLKIDVEGDKYRIYSVDEKNDMLEVLYSPLGLGVTARTEWIKTLKPAFKKEIKKYIAP